MRLSLAATVAFLVLRTAHAIPTLETGNSGLVVEKSTPSGQFGDPELQQRSSRFLNQATTREFIARKSNRHGTLTDASIRRQW